MARQFQRALTGRALWINMTLLLAAAGLIIATSTAMPTRAHAQAFAGFDSFCNVPVFVAPTDRVAFATRDRSGNPIIVIDPGAVTNWTHDRMFVLAHECGHHVLGHTTALGSMQRLYASYQQELDADCWAAQQLVNIMAVGDLQRTLQQFASQGPMRGGGYPSGWERATHAAQCAGIALQARRGGRMPYTPMPQPATTCATYYGPCRLGVPLAPGQPCYCPTPRGPLQGIAR